MGIPKNIAAWTAPGFDPAYVSINDISGHVVEICVRSAATPERPRGETVMVSLSHPQFASLVDQIIRWHRRESDEDTP